MNFLNPLPYSDFLVGRCAGSAQLGYSNYYLFEHPQVLQAQDTSSGFRATAYAAMASAASTAMSYSPYSVRDGGDTDCGGTSSRYCASTRDGTAFDLKQVMEPHATAIVALGTYFGYNPSASDYAQKAIAIMKTLTVDSGTSMEANGNLADIDYPIDLYVNMTPQLYGISYCLKYWESYEPSSLSTFLTWVDTYLTSMRNGTNSTQPSNKRNWYTAHWAACAAILEDATELQAAIDYHKAQFFSYVDTDGTIFNDRDRTDSIEGLGYSMLALNAMIMLAEIARVNGLENVWEYTGGGNTIEQILDAHVSYLSDDGTLWAAAGYQQNDMATAIEIAAPAYELAYTYFGKASYKGIVDLQTRPIYWRPWGFPTLTRGIT